MADFVFQELVNDPLAKVVSAKLGVDTSNPLADNDIGKAVKMAGSNNYVVCSNGDEIEGFVTSVEPYTKGGFSFGGVQVGGRKEATVDAAKVGTFSVGDLVVAGTSAALGTAGGLVVTDGAPATFKWRVIRIVSGTGAAGDTVLVEKV